ncbi:restriction endonuclease subunit R [Clostridiales bacterium S5-A14a]|nr:restriction endonuclease subunit R [Clostridiales bacterium S5-A14a]
MKVSLFPFQEIAIKHLRMNTAEALGAYQRTHTPQVISFTAPTGAGKTIIMTAFIESVLFGDEHYPEQPDAIFVWLSDSPELNEQSKLKIETKADKIRIGQCVTISDENFDKEFLEDGHIYLLNTQKIGKDKNLTKTGDIRTYTIWETLRNTAIEKFNRLYFIIDEAHRGMKDRAAAKATTIMQKFLKGSEEDHLLPMPVVLGMSATSERFNALVEGTSSTIHKVVVSPEEVRSSGLLKDRIVISYSEESSVNKAMAVLQAAADDWKDKWDHWKQYCYEQHYAYVNPVFVIQVENGTTSEISVTDLDDCIRKIEERTGFKFSKGEVVHTFGDTDADITIAGLEVPYEEPSRIQDNKKIKVVFFKENLSTGWDCPRAETMMSFRNAKDATYIAQLLGRMVRTPMQMHIQVDDSLNDVHLYLPFFEKETVEDVIKALQSEEGGSIPTDIYGESIENKKLETLTVRPKQRRASAPKQSPEQGVLDFYGTDDPTLPILRVEEAATSSNLCQSVNPDDKGKCSKIQPFQVETNLVTTSPISDHTSAEEADLSKDNAEIIAESKPAYVASDLPDIDREKIVKAINDSGLLTYNVRKIRINDYLKSMFALARLLCQTNIDASVLAKVHADIVKLITSYVEELKIQGVYNELVKKAKEFKLSTQVFDAFGESIKSGYDENSFYSTDVDIDRQFRVAETHLGTEGIGNEYLNTYFDPNILVDLKIDVILFATDDESLAKLNRYAKETYHALNDKYRRYMTKLTDTYRKQYDRIVSDGDVISKHNFRLPETITVAHDTNGVKYYNHLFVNDDGYAKIKLNDWEAGVLEEESSRENFVCWLRNPPRASWSLCIPYEKDGDMKPAYPDFIVIRKDPVMPGEFIIDVLEPHNPAFNDNLGKAKGFAEYARQNPGVGRIELIRKGKDAAGNTRFKRLDMSMSSVRDKVSQAMTDDELVHIFDTDGKFE